MKYSHVLALGSVLGIAVLFGVVYGNYLEFEKQCMTYREIVGSLPSVCNGGYSLAKFGTDVPPLDDGFINKVISSENVTEQQKRVLFILSPLEYDKSEASSFQILRAVQNTECAKINVWLPNTDNTSEEMVRRFFEHYKISDDDYSIAHRSTQRPHYAYDPC